MKRLLIGNDMKTQTGNWAGNVKVEGGVWFGYRKILRLKESEQKKEWEKARWERIYESNISAKAFFMDHMQKQRTKENR